MLCSQPAHRPVNPHESGIVYRARDGSAMADHAALAAVHGRACGGRRSESSRSTSTCGITSARTTRTSSRWSGWRTPTRSPTARWSRWRRRDGTIFTRETLVAIEDLTERLWQTPYVTRVDSITNYTHSEGREDELIVEPLIDEAGSLSDEDIERIERIALATQEVAGRFVSRDGRVAGLVVSRRASRQPRAGKGRGHRLPAMRPPSRRARSFPMSTTT